MTDTDLTGVDRRAPKVLIVDDDPAAVKFLADRCRKMGLTVQTATNGLQALIMARQNLPDALIVDVHMPELDGLSLCSRVLDPQQFGIDIIVMSGYADGEAAERCDSLGATYVRKGPALWPTVQSALAQIFPGMTVEMRDPPTAAPRKVREQPLILVIDDDPDIGKFLTTRLRKCGVDVMFAADAKRGYHIAVRERPSVIISDYFMSAADIHFLLWRLRSTAGMENVPVLAITGAALDDWTTANLKKGEFGRRGVERVFRKPLDIDELFSELKRYCALNYQPARSDGPATLPHAGGLG
ncbi:MAG TPA: response regulator [Xanthobacteraceae bacterium]|nr:response regulator [Xanthobacteraceae bacterium]